MRLHRPGVRAPISRGPAPAIAYRGSGGQSAVEPQRNRFAALLVTARPQQWVKNVLVVAAAGAAGALGNDDVPARIALAFAAFCLLASGIYAINDVRDAAEDRLHPRKRYRPVAAGELKPQQALVFGAALIAGGLALCLMIRPLLLLVGAAYLAITVSYTLLWRDMPLLDVGAVAGGFVLRAVAGGVAAPVTLSRWFLVVVTCAAVLVAAGKRHAELRRITLAGTGGRRVLELYGHGRLWLLMLASAGGALVAYCVWAFQLPLIDGVPWRPMTIIPFAACLVRYGVLVRGGEGEAPERLLFADRQLAVAAATWVALFALAVDAA